MLIGGVLLGLILGLLAGGSLGNLVSVRLRWVALLFGAVIVRFFTEAAIARDVGIAETLRLPLFAGAYVMLLVALWLNRRHPGLSIAFVGILGNTIAIIVNGGHMPIWEPSLAAAGIDPTTIASPVHTVLSAPLDAGFILRAGPLGDVIPIPFPLVQNVASIGDVFLTTGLGFFLFATLVRSPGELEEDEIEAALRQPRTRPPLETTGPIVDGPIGPVGRPQVFGHSLVPGGGYAGSSAVIDRPAPLAEVPSLLPPLVVPFAAATPATAVLPPPPSIPVPAIPPILERARRHPYVRLALNGSFTALWVGQTISLFGDRIHQVALAFLVLGKTNSPLAVGLVFVAATLPNLLLGPLAGTFVDRWNQKDVMVVSDLLRAAAVLLIPVAAALDVYLAYPLVFVVTSISMFFRPARTAVIPRIVREDELVTANSAMWLAENLADVVGYGFAGLFVAFLGSALPLAFWIDAATYVASGLLIASMTVPVVQAVFERHATSKPGRLSARQRLREEFLYGWRFLRREQVLLANTIQGTVGQFASGVVLTLAPLYARDVIEHAGTSAVVVYSFLDLAIGVGNLMGGFVVGLFGARSSKGPLIIIGYTALGAALVALGRTNSYVFALSLMGAVGIANMVYLIPSQTLFQERVPPHLIGRVVGFRFSIVFGAMTLAMAVSGLLAQVFGPAPVIAFFGLVTMAAGLGGLLVPAVRNA